MKTHIEGTVEGKVQNVFFRDSTRDFAEARGITGIVRNEPDGSVYLEAEGDIEQIEALGQWLEHGPPAADVDKVDLNEGKVRHYKNFIVQS